MSDRDHDKWVALIKGVKGVLGDHIDHQQNQIDAADDGHGAKATHSGGEEL